MSEAVEASGGRVVKLLGDGAMASFDSALGALRAAATIQSAVVRLDDEQDGLGIAARVGIAVGDLHGMPVVIAGRLCGRGQRGGARAGARVRARRLEFLDEHGVDTSELVNRSQTIINNGIIVPGGLVKAHNIAVGEGATIVDRLRGSVTRGTAT